MRSIKENVVMEVLPPLTMRHIPSIGAIWKGEGSGVEWQPSEGSDRNPTAIQSYFQKLRTPDNKWHSASPLYRLLIQQTQPSECDVVFDLCNPFRVPFAVQFKNYKLFKMSPHKGNYRNIK
jgi:hypothetical protein